MRRGTASGLTTIEAGVLAGAFAGGAMILFLIVVSAWRGLGAMTPLEVLGGVFFRHDPSGAGAVLLGLVVQGATSATLGVLFTALVARRTGPIESVAVGIVLAAVAWAPLTYLVAPIVDPALYAFATQAPFAWFGSHVVFGMVVASAREFLDVLEAHARQPDATAA